MAQNCPFRSYFEAAFYKFSPAVDTFRSNHEIYIGFMYQKMCRPKKVDTLRLNRQTVPIWLKSGCVMSIKIVTETMKGYIS